MPTKWQTVRVFISSTFRDMYAERDHLIRFVFPRLREELLKRRIHLVDVDLRWGVTSEQDALEVCREIIDECQPRFLCILGGRYGWTPSGQSRSITADEIHYAALEPRESDTEYTPYHYFYFRDPAATAQMVEEQPGEFRELADSDNERELDNLKQAVADAGYEPRVYQARWDSAHGRLVDLEEFGQQVYTDLLASVDAEFGRQQAEELDEFAEENAQMEAFIAERVERYVVGSRRSVHEELTAFGNGDGEHSVLVVTGAPGSGKSALLGKFNEDYRAAHPDVAVIPHFIGTSAGSTDLRRSLRRLCHQLAGIGDDTEAIPYEVKELKERFPELLEQAASDRRVVLVIDALDQLDATDDAHHMAWLPQRLPPNVRVVASSLKHPILETLRHHRVQVRVLEVQPLTQQDGRAIVEGYLKRIHKRMTDDQVNLLLAKPESGTPLYLLVALEELRTLGTYEEITERIEQLPGQVQALFLWILKERLSEDPGFQQTGGVGDGKKLVRKFVSCLGVSRHGLSHAELARVVDPGDRAADPPIRNDRFGQVAALERLLRPYLMRRGELLDFYHGQLREAVEGEYLDEPREPLEAHKHLAEYFAAQGYENVRTVSELPYHQTHGELWEPLEKTLCDLLFVEAKAKVGLVYDLVGDYTVALDALPELREERKRIEGLQKYSQDLIAYAEDDGPLPMPPDSRNAHASMRRTEGASSRERETCIDGSRVTRIRTSANFVSAHSQILDCFPEQAVTVAFNHAANGLIADQAGAVVGSLKSAWLRRDPRPLAPPAYPLCLRTMVGHSEYINGLAQFSYTAITASDDRTLRVWDVTRGQCLRILEGHSDYVNAVALSCNGRIAVSASDDFSLRVWDVERGDCSNTLFGHTSHVNAVSITLGGTIAISASEDCTLRIWKLCRGECLRVLNGHSSDVSSVALTVDGATAISGDDDGALRLWKVNDGTCLNILHGHTKRCTAILISDDGTVAVSASLDGTLRVWNVKRGECVRIMRHTKGVRTVAITPDGATAVSGSADGTLRIWDVVHGECLRVIQGHANGVAAVQLDPNATTAISAGDDRSVRVWDIVRGETTDKITTHSDRVNSVAVAPNGTTAVSGSDDKTLRVWDVTRAESVKVIHGHEKKVCAVAITSDGTIVSAGWDGTLRVSNVRDEECPRIIKRIPDFFKAVAVTPKGTIAIAADGGDYLPVWDIMKGECLWTLKGYLDGFTDVALTREGDVAISVSGDGSLRVWDVAGRRFLRTMVGHTGIVCAVALALDGRTAVSASEDKTLRIWDVASGKCDAVIEGHTHWVVDVALSPDGYTIVSTSEDRTLRVWSRLSGRMIALYPLGAIGTSVAAVSDKLFVVGTATGQLHFLTLQNWPN